jgi:hypothetical protein
MRVMPVFLDVDPRELRLLPSQGAGADPYKLQTQIARFGASTSGMPPPWVYQGSDGALVVYNGITRATRIAKLAPGTPIRVEVVGTFKRPVGHYPKIGDSLP